MPNYPTPRDLYRDGHRPVVVPLRPVLSTPTDRWEHELRRSAVEPTARRIGMHLTGYASADGVLGDRTPSTRRLARAVGVNRGDTKQALQQLQAAGWISRPPLNPNPSRRIIRPITLTLPADRRDQAEAVS